MHKNRALLLDRDGVVNIDHGYVGSAARFDFMPGLFGFLRAARDLGYRLAIVTNQSGVARGMYSVADYDALTAHMLGELRRQGVDIDLCLACFDHPQGAVAAHARDSFWRKPNPGMILETIRRLDLDAARSALIGDSLTDLQAAQAGGIGRCLWLTQNAPAAPDGLTIVADFAQALGALVE